MKKFRIVNITSGSGGGDSFRRAAKELESEGLIWSEFSSESIDRNNEVFQNAHIEAEKADLVIIRLHGGSPYFKELKSFIGSLPLSHQILVHSEVPEDVVDYRERISISDEDFTSALSYIHLGGQNNERGLLMMLGKKLALWDVEPPAPICPRTEGIYHPDCPPDIEIEEYRFRLDPSKPTAGLLFYQGHWLSGSLLVVDRMIRELERQGMNVIPVFYLASPDHLSGALGARRTVEKYFTYKGKTAVDLLIFTMGFSQIRLSDPGDGSSEEGHNFFADLGVPVMQAGFIYSTQDEWRSNTHGINPIEISGNIIWPEYDGQIICSPIGTIEDLEYGKEPIPIEERIVSVAKAAKRLAVLHSVPAQKKKVAIILYQNPPRRDRLGDAFGLDTPQSIVALLRALKDSGYLVEHIPNDGQELILEMLAGLADDEDWLSAEEMREKAAARVDLETYLSWFSSLPLKCQEEMTRDWGEAPGDILTLDGELLIPGLKNGNVFLAIQPPRGRPDASDSLYHDDKIVIPHQYLAYYRWIQEIFGAHAIIHMGTHGTLEWLPGKSLALSEECYPDIVLKDTVNIYPYIMSNPGEGMQAKRRSRAIIVDHLPPALTRAGSYEELEILEGYLQSYFHAEHGGPIDKAEGLLHTICSLIRKMNLLNDLGIDEDADDSVIEGSLPSIYDYLNEVKDSLIKDGLHIFGQSPEGERMEEMVYSLTWLCNGKLPSLRQAVAEAMGVNILEALRSPSSIHESGELNAALIEKVENTCMDLIRSMRVSDFDETASLRELNERRLCTKDTKTVISYICRTLVPNILQTKNEISGVLTALNGGYVLPGPSGTPSRGNAHLLPSGRNFYSIDPRSIPTPAAWDVGKAMADQMIQRHIKETGKCPESVGMVMFATDTMKTGGDDIAYLLWLMGLKPVWAGGTGRVTGLEVIPLDELKRPRIDVTLRISGLFRDSFANLMDLIDEGVRTVASLSETPENNYLSKHLEEDLAKSVMEGIDKSEARSKALIRIFGCPPGTYGGGVDRLIETSSWENAEDLAEAFISWGGFAYGGGRKGEESKDVLRRRLSITDVTVKNHSSRELDMLDNDDDYIYHGGLIAAVRTARDGPVSSFVGNSSDPDNVRLRSTAEEGRFIFRSRVLNPKWVEGLKKHGYRGAAELSALVDYSFAWDAAAGIIEPWMYQSLTERFLFDDDNREWLESCNPYALRHMSGRLLEAIDREMWTPDEAVRKKLENIYLDTEESLEGNG